MYKYEQIARQARVKVLSLIYKSQVSHIGSNFSAIDIMTVLLEKADVNKDEVILSKGWAAAAWYFFLNRKGIITDDELNSFCQPNSKFIGLTEPQNHWGLRFAGGSMGLAFPAAVGFALSKKLKGEKGTVYCLMSDGEMQIGTTWESALIAAHHKLDNLVVFVDNNNLQAMGKTNEILNIRPLKDKWLDFGWSVTAINGHVFEEIEKSFFGPVQQFVKLSESPSLIIAKTIKGKGISWMEADNLWHYSRLSDEDYQKALKELNG